MSEQEGFIPEEAKDFKAERKITQASDAAYLSGEDKGKIKDPKLAQTMAEIEVPYREDSKKGWLYRLFTFGTNPNHPSDLPPTPADLFDVHVSTKDEIIKQGERNADWYAREEVRKGTAADLKEKGFSGVASEKAATEQASKFMQSQGHEVPGRANPDLDKEMEEIQKIHSKKEAEE